MNLEKQLWEWLLDQGGWPLVDYPKVKEPDMSFDPNVDWDEEEDNEYTDLD